MGLAPDVAQLGALVRSSVLLKSIFFLPLLIKSKAGAKQMLCALSGTSQLEQSSGEQNYRNEKHTTRGTGSSTHPN